MSELEKKTAETNGDPIDSIEPDDLMLKVRKVSLMKGLVYALIIHIILILVTSIGYLSDCSKYKTFSVKAAKKIEGDNLKKAEEEARKKELLKKAEEEAKKKLEESKNKPAEAAKPAAKSAEDIMKKNPDNPVIKELNETSKERPTSTTTSLDGDLL